MQQAALTQPLLTCPARQSAGQHSILDLYRHSTRAAAGSKSTSMATGFSLGGTYTPSDAPPAPFVPAAPARGTRSSGLGPYCSGSSSPSAAAPLASAEPCAPHQAWCHVTVPLQPSCQHQRCRRLQIGIAHALTIATYSTCKPLPRPSILARAHWSANKHLFLKPVQGATKNPFCPRSGMQLS